MKRNEAEFPGWGSTCRLINRNRKSVPLQGGVPRGGRMDSRLREETRGAAQEPPQPHPSLRNPESTNPRAWTALIFLSSALFPWRLTPSKSGVHHTCLLYLQDSLSLSFQRLFLRETERGQGSEREPQNPSRLQALSCQHRARCGARTHGPRDHDPSRSWRLNRRSHPGPALSPGFNTVADP